jgi:MGT family glycosyltransferase
MAMIRRAREWIVGTIPDQIADLRELVARWQPDVLGAEASMWGPLLVLSELLPIPVALVSPLIGAQVPGPDAPVPGGLAPPGSARARWMQLATGRATDLLARRTRQRVDELRAEHGLAPMRCSVNEFFGRLPLYLVLNVPELDYRRRDLPPSVHYVGPCLWHPPERRGTEEWLAGLPSERPWVHVTEGTAHVHEEAFLLRAAAGGLPDVACEAILTTVATGRGRRADQLGLRSSATNVHVAPWLSHDALLPRCAAIVTTGGMGTVMAALRAAVPLVVVPTQWDKPANARRVVDVGAGLRLAPRRCTPARLRAAVEEVLEDPQYRECARRSAEWLAAAPGPPGAAQLIEGLVSNRRGREQPDVTVPPTGVLG